MKRFKYSAYFLVFALVLAFSPAYVSEVYRLATKPSQSEQPESKVLSTQSVKKDLYKVVKVIDGDTIEVEVNSEKQKVRLLGVNTPETLDPRKEVECFGKEASNYAKNLLQNNYVQLESDATQDNADRYNRLLRYVYLDDGTLVNKKLIVEGYAYEYTYKFPYKYQQDFKQAQKDAESASKGLWSQTTGCQEKNN